MGRSEGVQVSRTIPGHRHPVELDPSGLALSGLSLAWALYALRMQGDEERVKRIEGCSGLPAVGLAAPYCGLRVERRAAG